VEDFAPNLVKFVKPEARKISVAAALQNNQWVAQIRGALSIPAIAEFLTVWERIQLVVNLGIEDDKVLWKLTPAGVYSSSSAYQAYFLGQTRMMAAGCGLREPLTTGIKLYAEGLQPSAYRVMPSAYATPTAALGVARRRRPPSAEHA
jgi:hypothetical protein